MCCFQVQQLYHIITLSACKVRAVKLDPGVKDGEKGVFFPPLIGFSVYTEQDTSTDALGGGGHRGRSGLMEVHGENNLGKEFLWKTVRKLLANRCVD